MNLRQTLAALPRDARDTLFMLCVIAWVIAPLVRELPVWTSVAVALLLLLRGTLAWRAKPLPGRWTMHLLMLCAVAGTLLTHRTIVGRDPGLTLVILLLALKTLEARAQRDAMVIFFLAFFSMLSNFFYSQSLATAAAMLLGLLGLLTALVNAHRPVGRPPLWQSARTAGALALMGAPIMLVLFLLFPRLAPLWGMPNDPNTARSGLSGEMQVGQVARLALDDSIALRVKFDGPPPPQGQLYFRGPVLSGYDGQRWTPLVSDFPRQLALPSNLRVRGEPVRYEVTMEPHDRPWVFLLEAAINPPEVPATEVRMSTELQWLTRRPMGALVRYRAESYLDFRHGPTDYALALQDHLNLPPSYNPRTLVLAQELRRQYGPGPDAAPALIQAVLERLRTGGYVYTLEPGVYGRDTADEFWFDRKAGFCEHIASSFVILMRALDIPARVVTGYQGGEVNNVDGYWTVRQRDAHAWAEVWLQGEGWVRVDPTGAVAPARLGSLQRAAAPQGALAGMVSVALSPSLQAQLRATWEAINNRWNQWVLNYTQGQQLDLLRRLGFSAPSWTDLAYVLAGVVGAVSLAGALWMWWERRRQDPWLRLLERARARLQRLGLDTTGLATPRALALAVRARWGTEPAAEAVVEWLLALESQRYAPPERRAPLAVLQSGYRQLAWPAVLPR